MLIQFNFKNFKSFKNETSFDMTAASIKEHQYNLIDIGTDDKYLRVSAIYGANASGKSNMIEAFQFMSYYVFASLKENGLDIESREQNIPIKNYFFDNESKKAATLFEVFFIYKGLEYQYGFIVDKEKVHEEWLLAKKIKAKKFKSLFYREKGRIDCGKDFKDAEKFKASLQEKTLFISLLAQTKIEKAENVYGWFIKSNVMNFGDARYETFLSRRLNFVRKLKEDLYRSKLEEFMMAIDTGIVGVRVEEIIMNSSSTYKIYTKHKVKDSDELEEIELSEESSGTQKMFLLFNYFSTALTKGDLLFIDELDAKLHPLLLRYIITMFHDKDTNKKNAQLIYSTHDVYNLTRDLFRRDQIWFVEKDDYGVSSLYSLAEYNLDENTKVRNDATYNKDYISGRYGAVPLLKEFKMIGDEE
ncbi:MAG: ATP-binding protein [Clostridia bacterium]|nr:ATP-binding protein [Clostridia bacterium]